MKRTFHVGQTVYHGWRYWKIDDLEAGEVPGWNTLYLPYRVVKITTARIVVEYKTVVYTERVHLNRATMEREGKQYHSRFHEYFYAEKPAPESKEWNWAGSQAAQPVFFRRRLYDPWPVASLHAGASATRIQTPRAKTASRSRREPSGLYQAEASARFSVEICDNLASYSLVMFPRSESRRTYEMV